MVKEGRARRFVIIKNALTRFLALSNKVQRLHYKWLPLFRDLKGTEDKVTFFDDDLQHLVQVMTNIVNLGSPVHAAPSTRSLGQGRGPALSRAFVRRSGTPTLRSLSRGEDSSTDRRSQLFGQ